MINLNKILSDKIFLGIIIGLLIYNVFSFGYKQGWFAKKYEYDFRNTKWGMTVEEVKTLEDGELVKDGITPIAYDILEYKNDVDGYEVTTKYEFFDNKLTNARYYFHIDESNLEINIEAYKKIKKELIDKYGNPDYQSKNCDPAKVFVCSSRWKTFHTDINLILSDLMNQSNYNLDLSYSSTKLQKVRDQVMDSLTYDEF